MDTLSKVRFLYGKLNVGATEDQQTLYDNWLKFIATHEKDISRFYSDDGHPAIIVTRGATGVPICGYRWLPPDVECAPEEQHPIELPPGYYTSNDWKAYDSSKVRGVIFFSHGITESCRFSLLNLKTIEKAIPLAHLRHLKDHHKTIINEAVRSDDCCVQQFAGGWADSLTRAGYVLYGLDMQGHGLSQSWRNSRCNVEHFSHYIDDTFSVIKTLHLAGEWAPSTPIFISGLSMGGCIATRVCQIAFSRGEFQTLSDALGPSRPRIAGLILFCPAVTAERLKKHIINRIMMTCGRLVSTIFPTSELASLATPDKFPWLLNIIQRDPLVHTRRLPARLSYETVTTMEQIFPEVHWLPPNLRVCLIQSKADTMTDPEGSATFVSMLACKETSVHWLDYGWHFLSKEPGHGHTVNLAIAFMDSVTSTKQEMLETSGSDTIASNDASQ